ncbi:MAG: Maf family nucleotide pyrophosphatase [Acidobacteriota bacterium]
MRLILASTSPRRRSLLGKLLDDFAVVAPEVREDGAIGDPAEVAERLAREKAVAVAVRYPGHFVLAADTLIDLDGDLLGKPAGAEDALAMLSRLAGRSHRVVTGVAVAKNFESDRILRSGTVASEVVMRSLPQEELQAYVATGEPLDKAGAYAIQGAGSRLVAGFSGCYYNIVGLPLCECVRLLRAAGWTQELDPRVCRLPGGGLCPRAERGLVERTG